VVPPESSGAASGETGHRVAIKLGRTVRSDELNYRSSVVPLWTSAMFPTVDGLACGRHLTSSFGLCLFPFSPYLHQDVRQGGIRRWIVRMVVLLGTADEVQKALLVLDPGLVALLPAPIAPLAHAQHASRLDDREPAALPRLAKPSGKRGGRSGSQLFQTRCRSAWAGVTAPGRLERAL
jgi:hypothetical protein